MAMAKDFAGCSLKPKHTFLLHILLHCYLKAVLEVGPSVLFSVSFSLQIISQSEGLCLKNQQD